MPFKITKNSPLPAQSTAIITINFEKIYTEIRAIVEQVVSHEASRAHQIATERAPVRKVFKGSRARRRPLSVEELTAETPAFLRSLSPSQRQQLGRVPRGSFPAARIGTLTTTQRNRENLWRHSSADRLLVLKDGTLQFARREKVRDETLREKLQITEREVPRSLEEQKRLAGKLTSEGRAAGRNANLVRIGAQLVDVGRGALYVSPSGEIYLGGNLRHSVHIDDRDTGQRIRKVVIAGGPRAPYAKFVEFGTRHAASQPFLRPALKRVETTYPQTMRAALKRLMAANPITG